MKPVVVAASILAADDRGLAVELGVRQGWDRYVGARGDMLGIDAFGASARAKVLLEKYGFTVDPVIARARRLLAA